MADILNEKYITFSRKFFPVPQDMTQMHAHMNHEIYFLVSGARRYFIKDAVYDVSANDVVIIPHWELHRTVTNFPLECERCLIYFPDIYTADIRREIGNAAFEDFLRWGCFCFSEPDTAYFKMLVSQIEAESANTDSLSRLMLSEKLTELLVFSIRRGSPKGNAPDKDAQRMQIATRYIRENYAQPIRLHDAAQLVYLEDSYFCRQFKKHTGFGFQEYLTQLRLQTAANLLMETDLSVNEIAGQCGFSGGNYFGDAFKRAYNLSPMQYRKAKHESE